MSTNIRITQSQMAMLEHIAAGLPSHPQGSAQSADLHEQLACMGLIGRIYVDPRDPAHRLNERQAGESGFQAEIYMRWQRRWTLTALGESIIAGGPERASSGAANEEETSVVAGSASRHRVELMRFGPGGNSLIVRFASVDSDAKGVPADPARGATDVCVSLRRGESLLDTIRRARALIEKSAAAGGG